MCWMCSRSHFEPTTIAIELEHVKLVGDCARTALAKRRQQHIGRHHALRATRRRGGLHWPATRRQAGLGRSDLCVQVHRILFVFSSSDVWTRVHQTWTKKEQTTHTFTHTPGPNTGRTPTRSHPDRHAHKQASQNGRVTARANPARRRPPDALSAPAQPSPSDTAIARANPHTGRPFRRARRRRGRRRAPGSA